MTRQTRTQVRQHAPENGESSGGLLVELVEDSTRQALQVIERTGWCRSHLACRAKIIRYLCSIIRRWH